MNPFGRAILHIDGDAFFASCEVSLNPSLKGKPVVIGRERGIVTAQTYEAKAAGVSRGMTMNIVRQLCPKAVILPGDFHSYGLFSKRMFAIVRRYANFVEEYSIDECFADLSDFGLDEAGYRELLSKIQNDVLRELGITVSLGLAPTKVLAKVASKWKKPFGLTIIAPERISDFLLGLPIGKIWGIGRQTAEKLLSLQIKTAHDLSSKAERWVADRFSQPLCEIWHELQGTPIHSVHHGPHGRPKSIMKTRTFPVSTGERRALLSELSKNAERACFKARRYGLAARELSFFLKTTEFRYHSTEVKLSQATASPEAILRAVRMHFDSIYRKGYRYRASGIILRGITDAYKVQGDLFGEVERLEGIQSVHKHADELSKKFGKNTVFLASSMEALKSAKLRMNRDGFSERGKLTEAGNFWHRLNLLYLGQTT